MSNEQQHIDNNDGERVAPKRVLTASNRKYNLAFNARPSPSGIPSDLNIALQNVGSRVRRTVSEGYKTHRAPTDPPVTSSSNAQQPLFRSAADTLHDVYSQPRRELGRFCDTAGFPMRRSTSASFASDIDEAKKRTRGDEDDGSLEGDSEMGETPGPLPGRSIRPLRRTLGGPRTLGKTQSLPAHAFGPSDGRASSPDFDDMDLELRPKTPEDWQSVGFSTFCARDPD
ncbi:hypothetical protein BOTBODRAFT_173878 [Botryobasidium botryosum FD-172 SS1]|uniref:Uncharacterized protein n=1 Tax=Botryobasidium botryosum (strain FD-172 SS1) TaxID=930990 RepID=A0A067ML05_BOTB1|nr:hypothetical protein BOTBODRAFT_173878 [Botryobasidium botryosum FD-172 SS1]